MLYCDIRYDTTEEFNVDSEAECDHLNLAHAARRKYKKKKLKLKFNFITLKSNYLQMDKSDQEHKIVRKHSGGRTEFTWIRYVILRTTFYDAETVVYVLMCR